MPFNRYQPGADGAGATFYDDTAGTSFTAYGPAAGAQALQLDAAAGAPQPIDFYHGLSRPPSMATSPEALAAAPEGVGRAGGAAGAAGAGGAPARVEMTGPGYTEPEFSGGAAGAGGGPRAPLTAAEASSGAIGASGAGVGRAGPAEAPPPAPAAQAGPPASGVAPAYMASGPRAGGAAGGQEVGGAGGTGNWAYDEWQRRAQQPGRLVTTKSAWVDEHRTTKRELGPDDKSLAGKVMSDMGLAETQAEGAEGRADNEQKQADLLGTMVPEEAKRLDEATTAVDRFRKNSARLMAEVDEDRRKLAEAKVNPNEFFESQSVGESALNVVGILMGAVGQAITGGKSNVALDILNNRVQQSIDAQRENLAQGNRNLSASERRVDAEAKQLGSMEAALDLQSARAWQALAAKAKQNEAEAKSDAERQAAREIIAGAEAKRDDFLMRISAATRGEVTASEKFRQGGTAVVGGVTTKELLEGAKVRHDITKEGPGAKGLNTVTSVDGTNFVLSPSVGTEEAGKAREVAAVLNSTMDEIDKLTKAQSGIVDAIIDPKQAEAMAVTVGAGVNKGLGEGAMTSDNEQRYQRTLTGMRVDAAQKFTREFLHNMAARRIEQVAVGTLDPRSGTVVPLAGKERLAPK